MSLKDEPFAIHLRFGADIFQPGFYIKNPSISIEDSSDYLNVTAYFNRPEVGITIFSSFKPEKKTTINANFPWGDYYTYHDQLSNIIILIYKNQHLVINSIVLMQQEVNQ